MCVSVYVSVRAKACVCVHMYTCMCVSACVLAGAVFKPANELS